MYDARVQKLAMQKPPSKDPCLLILYLVDGSSDAELFQWKLLKLGRRYSILRAAAEDQFKKAFEKGAFNLMVSDSGVLGGDVFQILAFLRHRLSQIPLILFSGNTSPQLTQRALDHGATEVVSKDSFPQWLETIRRVLTPAG